MCLGGRIDILVHRCSSTRTWNLFASWDEISGLNTSMKNYICTFVKIDAEIKLYSANVLAGIKW